jgi:phosphoenolpyruvate synthase/pyruvate phosphate dikinase
MREREEIEQEIEERRESLVQNIEELQAVVRDKVQQVKDKVDVRKRAREAFARGKQEARAVAVRIEKTARERPELVVAVAGGLLLIAVGMKVRRVRRQRRAPAGRR